MQNPRISVLMGIYNCANTLEEAIDSIIKQTFSEWELILCDDGSTDNTFTLAKSYENRFPEKIRVIKNEKNIRLAATLNHCAKYAKGEFIARMDGDDLSESSRFEKQVAFLDAHPEYALVGTYMQSFDEHGKKNIIPIKAYPEKRDLPKFNPFHHATVLMRKSVFDELGGYKISSLTTRAEDVDLWFRFFAAGYRGYNLSDPLYFVREDTATFKRRTWKHSLEASRVLVRGIKMLELPLPYYLYSIKPIVSQVTPTVLKRKFRQQMEVDNQRGKQ